MRRTRWKPLLALVVAAFAVGAAGVILLSRGPTPPSAPVAVVPSAAAPTVPPPTAEVGLPHAVGLPASRAAAGRAVPPPAPPKRDQRREATPQRSRATGVAQAVPAQATNVGPLPEPGRARPGAGAEASVLKKYNDGVAALDRGDTAEAVGRFREATADSPDLVEAWNGLGLALLRQGKLPEADAAMTRCLALAPRYVPGLLNAGLVRLAEGRFEEGSALFQRAAEIAPDSPAALVNLAVAQTRQGRLADAQETLTAARRRFPGDPDVLYHLGAAFEREGNRVGSIEAYEAFLAASAGARPSLEERVRNHLRSLQAGAPRR